MRLHFPLQVSNANGYMCHIHVEVEFPVPPGVLFQIFTHPGGWVPAWRRAGARTACMNASRCLQGPGQWRQARARILDPSADALCGRSTAHAAGSAGRFQTHACAWSLAVTAMQ